MFRSYMLFIGFLTCVSFKYSYHTGILFLLHGIHGKYTRFGTQGNFANFNSIFHILIYIFGMDFDF